MSRGLGVELCLPTVGLVFAVVRRRSRPFRIILLTLCCEVFSWHGQWIRHVVDVLWYFCRGGDTICGMHMDLTQAFCVAGGV